MAPQHVETPLSALDAIFTRRSVREYTPFLPDKATVSALLDAAVQAPTAMHGEPWSFVIVQDRAMLERLSDRVKASWAGEAAHYRALHQEADPAAAAFAARIASPDFNVFYGATTLIVICARPLGPFVAADCWLAAENLMLAASALGLGSCCIGASLSALNTTETKTELGIAADVQAIAPIVVGVPRGPVVESTRRAPDVLAWFEEGRAHGKT